MMDRRVCCVDNYGDYMVQSSLISRHLKENAWNTLLHAHAQNAPQNVRVSYTTIHSSVIVLSWHEGSNLTSHWYLTSFPVILADRICNKTKLISS